MPPEVPGVPDRPVGHPPLLCGKPQARFADGPVDGTNSSERAGTATPPRRRQAPAPSSSVGRNTSGAASATLSEFSAEGTLPRVRAAASTAGAPGSPYLGNWGVGAAAQERLGASTLAPVRPRRRPMDGNSDHSSLDDTLPTRLSAKSSLYSTLSPYMLAARPCVHAHQGGEEEQAERVAPRFTIAKAMRMSVMPMKWRQSKCDVVSSVEDSMKVDRALKGPSQQKKERKVFEDVSQLKSQVHKALEVPVYNVMDFYSSSGACQAIARSKLFENAILWVIFSNTIWIAVDAEFNNSDILLDAPTWVQVCEHFFCFVFFGEWIVSFGAFESKINCLRDRAFVFDSMLVLMSVMETWVMTAVILLSVGADTRPMGNTQILRLFKLIRIFRMARVARLLRAIPELMVLIKGVISASRSVFLTMVLLCTVVFLFGVTFKQLTRNTALGEKNFKSLGSSMFNLLIYATFPDFAQIVEDASGEHFVFGFLLLVYVFIAFFTVLNLLVGVIVQVVEVVSVVEHEEIMVKDVRRRLLRALEELFPESHCGERTMISRADFQMLICTPTTARAIHELGVDVVGLLESEDFIFSDASQDLLMESTTEQIAFGSFMEAVLQLRGSNQATVKDIVNLRKGFLRMMGVQEDHLVESINAGLSDLSRKLSVAQLSIEEDEA